MFKKTFSNEGDVNETVDSASAFQEMGLHGEAIAEYVKMFKEDYPAEKIVPGLVYFVESKTAAGSVNKSTTVYGTRWDFSLYT